VKTKIWNTNVFDFLRTTTWLDNAQLDEALQYSESVDDAKLDTVLLSLGALDEDQYAELLSHLLKLKRWSDGANFFIEEQFYKAFNLSFLAQHQIVPVAIEQTNATLGFVSPHEQEGFDYLKFIDKDIELVVLTQKEFELIREQQKAMSERVDVSEFSGNIEQLRRMAQGAPTVNLVNNLISKGIKLGASDLHIEPVDGKYRARYRIDGILKEADPIPVNLQIAVVSRIKILSGMDIAEKRRPQDGKIETRVGQKEIDIRCSALPLGFGESIVMRFLVKDSIRFELSDLGYEMDLQSFIDEDLQRSTGVILMTGPTGSGKTTSLYSFLNKINNPESKIITLEDPIEYQLPGVNQVQVKSDIGFDFAAGLRSILRQDPDIIMVGEIRDGETAKIALQSALTGHLVFSTVHTNDAPTAYTRLLDLGLEEYLLNAGLVSIMAQRLVRKLCPHCSTPYDVPEALKQKYNLQALEQQFCNFETVYKKSVGCQACEHTGFIGRVAILEYLPCTDDIRQMEKDEQLLNNLYQYMRDHKYRNLQQDGFLKAARGLTTIEEVLRVTG